MGFEWGYSIIKRGILLPFSCFYKKNSTSDPTQDFPSIDSDLYNKTKHFRNNRKKLCDLFVPSSGGSYVELKYGKTHYILCGHSVREQEHQRLLQHSQSENPLVILLHGASMFSFVWNRFAQLFVGKGDYTVLIFDFYGHGHSAIPSVQYTHELFVEQLEELLLKLNLLKYYNSLYLIGHSMGGLIASEFTKRHTDLVSRLILLNSAGLPMDTSFPNLLAAGMDCMCKILRKTVLFDRGVSLLETVVKITGSLMIRKVCHEDLSTSAFDLSEEDETQKQQEILSKVYSDIETGKSMAIDDHSKKRAKQMNSTLEMFPMIFVPSLKTIPFLWKHLEDTIFSMISSNANAYTTPQAGQPSHPLKRKRSHWIRLAHGICFLYKVWIYQISLGSRTKVLLSIGRHFPLLDADRSETFRVICRARVPVMVLWGEHDSILPYHSAIREFRRFLPDAQCISLDGDHALFLQRPSLVFNAIMQFIHHPTTTSTITACEEMFC